jgi:predicted SAM-dependent methyltransferase
MLKSMKARLKSGWLGGPAIALYRASHTLHRTVTGNDKRVIQNHLAEQPLKKLQIGCGTHPLDGWLNSDFYPKSKEHIHLDATKRFPLADETLDYVYCEHMIEHINYPSGHSMLKECFRVLKVGGKVRVATPDLAFLIDLYRPDKSPLQVDYVMAGSIYCNAPVPYDTFVINNFVRDWGHQFIYDEKTLRYSLEQAGFEEITRFGLSQSHDAALQNLEFESRRPPGMLNLETMTFEGTKKAAKTVG